ncbi:oxidoreductase [Paenibacillus agaridevorans]|uniref:Oxidoreductase n=1 Tax=Paenibacillus agaridevorans TaxID=171404 RepID=A0A2R5EVR3_9BACL|nr:oxidoreductase [Paenibacillus agaridevorans]
MEELSFFKDMFAIFNKKELVFLESLQEDRQVYSFLFEKPKDLTWNAGQYGLFTPNHKKIKNGTKPFSIASAPSENVIRLTTRVGENPSEFKTAMSELKKGMTVKMSGPVGAFTLTDNNPSLLIAGGIGITPFRSILKQLDAEGNKDASHIHLVYTDTNKSYIFKDELDDLANKMSFRITYLDSRDDLQQEIGRFAASHKVNGRYYIAGPKSFVDLHTEKLKQLDVAKGNIKKDAFWGYS